MSRHVTYAVGMTITEVHVNRAAYIRALLAWHGLRQADLGRIMGCSQANASQKLAGLRRFTTDDLLAIAEALDVDPRYLLTVPRYERGLLTCTKCQLAQVRRRFTDWVGQTRKNGRYSVTTACVQIP